VTAGVSIYRRHSGALGRAGAPDPHSGTPYARRGNKETREKHPRRGETHQGYAPRRTQRKCLPTRPAHAGEREPTRDQQWYPDGKKPKHAEGTEDHC
jgi:hypothetical protein